MCFLYSVNRSLYNDCFWAVSGLLVAFCFLFVIFPHTRCKSELGSISEWHVWYLKGQTWWTLKAATGISDHGVKTRISVEQRAKALVFKKNRRSSPLEIAWKCQIESQLYFLCFGARVKANHRSIYSRILARVCAVAMATELVKNKAYKMVFVNLKKSSR